MSHITEEGILGSIYGSMLDIYHWYSSQVFEIIFYFVRLSISDKKNI